MDNRNVKKLVNSKVGVHNLYLQIISLNNLFTAWREFKVDKEKKQDVIEFAFNLENNIFTLHEKLKNFSYQHSNYISFRICDPKPRHIHKAKVCDRVLHHAIVRIIEPIFNKGFIFDSYSSRKGKGTHRAIKKCQQLAWKLSKNDTKTVWALKCDISKFFDSVNHEILLKLLSRKIKDKNLMDLLDKIIRSYSVRKNSSGHCGIPLGNLTSQLFSNVYLNQLDQFVKRNLSEKCYVRYADDFIILSRDKTHLENLIPKLRNFLREDLKLLLHPKKIILKRWNNGIDFLGYNLFPHHIILRTKTKRRILKKIRKNFELILDGSNNAQFFQQSLQSYLGILKHCRGAAIEKNILKIILASRN